MPFDRKGFQKTGTGAALAAAGARVNSLHFYVTNDDNAAVVAANYFASMWEHLAPGDIIIASLDRDGTPKTMMYHVLTSTSAGVTVQIAFTLL